MAKQQAIIKSCTDDIEHQMRDGCWTCAPYWIKYPLCPICFKANIWTKLNKSGWCEKHHKYFDLGVCSKYVCRMCPFTTNNEKQWHTHIKAHGINMEDL